MQKLNYIIFPALVERISKEGSNETSVKRTDVYLLRIISCFLLVCIAAMSLLGPFVYQTPAPLLLMDIGIFFAIAAVSFALSFVNINTVLESHIVALIYNMVFFYSVVRFYELAGSAIWTFAFILILISTARLTNIMLVFTGVTLTASLLYVRFGSFVNYPADDVSISVHAALFIAVYIIARIIFGVNVMRLQMIDKHVKELNAQIDERKKVEAENLRLALYDNLTGLPNRLLFTGSLRRAIESFNCGGPGLYVMFMDIDFFKRINDTLGHTLGDELLKYAGERISAVFGGGSVCRTSGDEFLAMAQCDGEKAAAELARRALLQFRKPFSVGAHQLNITCSVGIAMYPRDGNDVESLIKCADFAMYKAKQDGKNRFEMYSPTLEKAVMKEIEMVVALQSALENHEFALYYQPQVGGDAKEIIGYEALIRWNYPGGGTLLPMSFIPAAEKSGLIAPIGQWVIREACRQNKQWQDMGLPRIPVSVNISAVQINNKPLYDTVRRALSETKLAPEYLQLEITESTFICDDRIRRELDRVKSMGVKIAIDDFGTGSSAIQYVKDFPFDFIKIPRNFISGISVNERDEAIINVILSLAESLKIGVIAEGVENKTQYEFLSQKSCRNIQGYYFYRPIPAESIPELFSREC